MGRAGQRRLLPFLVRSGYKDGFWWARYRTLTGSNAWKVSGCDSDEEARAELREFVREYRARTKAAS